MSINNNINDNDSDDDIFNIFNEQDKNKQEKNSFSKMKMHINNLNNLNSNNNIEDKEEQLIKRKEQEKVKNDIRDKLKCFICYGKVNNAMMCPFCKKIACEKCITNSLQKTNICSNCKSILLLNELVKVPIINDFTSYFINSMEQSNDNEENDKDNEIEEMNELKKQKCQEHPNKNIEYICMDCNEYLCSVSLLFFNQESLFKHNGHIILSFDDIEKFNLFKVIKEYKNLPENKNKLNEKIINIKKTKKEFEQRKKSINYICSTLKNDIKSKYESKIYIIKSLINSLKDKKKKIEKMIQNPPNLMNEIKSEEENERFLKELKSLNKLENEVNILEKESNFTKTLKCEQYNSELFEIKFPNNGEYIEEFISSKIELKFIPNTKCMFNYQLLLDNCIFTLILNVDKNFIKEHFEKFIGYLSVENNKEKISKSLQGYLSKNELIFSTQCSFNQIKEMMNENNKCSCKINMTIFYYK